MGTEGILETCGDKATSLRWKTIGDSRPMSYSAKKKKKKTFLSKFSIALVPREQEWRLAEDCHSGIPPCH